MSENKLTGNGKWKGFSAEEYQIDELQEQLCAKDAEIADLKLRLANAESSISSLEDQATSQLAKIAELEQQKRTLESGYRIQESRLVAARKETDELKRQLEEAQNTLLNKDELLAGKSLTIVQCWKELDAARKDTERLNKLERRRLAFNAHYGTNYGWKFATGANINRLFVSNVNIIDLNDTEANAGNIREAIDSIPNEAIDAARERKAESEGLETELSELRKENERLKRDLAHERNEKYKAIREAGTLRTQLNTYRQNVVTGIADSGLIIREANPDAPTPESFLKI